MNNYMNQYVLLKHIETCQNTVSCLSSVDDVKTKTTPAPKNVFAEIHHPKHGFDSFHPPQSFVPGSENCCHSPTSAPGKSKDVKLSSCDMSQNS